MFKIKGGDYKMKALVKKEPARGLWFEEVPEPVTGPNDVKIKIHKTAICGTDLHIYNWDEWSQKTIETPRIIGHEYVGEIVETGSNVKNWKVLPNFLPKRMPKSLLTLLSLFLSNWASNTKSENFLIFNFISCL